jgi:hypothetical protein
MSTRASNSRAQSAAGNLSRADSRSTNLDKGLTRTATTIAFTAPGTITDSGNGLAVFAAGQRVRVIGSARNSRPWTVATSAAGTLTVTPTLLTTEAAGPTITLTLED